MSSFPDWLRPDWPDDERIGALMTTRAHGRSTPPFAGFNLRDGLGDKPGDVEHHRALLRQAMEGASPVWLNQVHGAKVVRVDEGHARPGPTLLEADASVTNTPNIACTVMVADCLPVLFAALNGQAVGAAHAGWRGVAGGVLEATLNQVCSLAACKADQVRAWLGACIGPRQFEVGADVLDAFAANPSSLERFAPQAHQKWLADLPGLARDRLHAAGVLDVSGGTWCTVSDPERFYSFRRDGVTGRMAAGIWIRPEMRL